MEESVEKAWLPIESNPGVMTAYARKLGLPSSLGFHDILSTEAWALEMVPQPVLAALMLFPIKEASEAHRVEEAARVAAGGLAAPPPQLYYCKQTVSCWPAGCALARWSLRHELLVWGRLRCGCPPMHTPPFCALSSLSQVGNACGTIGILHAVANASTLTGGGIELGSGSWFDRFLRRTLTLDPDARATALETDVEVEAEHGEVVAQGQSAVVDDTWQHFIAFVEKDGRLWELDGRKATPIDAGPTTPETLLADACAAMQRFMDRDPSELRFTMVAMAAAGEEEEEEED